MHDIDITEAKSRLVEPEFVQPIESRDVPQSKQLDADIVPTTYIPVHCPMDISLLDFDPVGTSESKDIKTILPVFIERINTKTVYRSKEGVERLISEVDMVLPLEYAEAALSGLKQKSKQCEQNAILITNKIVETTQIEIKGGKEKDAVKTEKVLDPVEEEPSCHEILRTYTIPDSESLKDINICPYEVNTTEFGFPQIEEKRVRGKRTRIQKHLKTTSKTMKVVREVQRNQKGNLVHPIVDTVFDLIEVEQVQVQDRVTVCGGREVIVKVPIYKNESLPMPETIKEEKNKKGIVQKRVVKQSIAVATRRRVNRTVIINESDKNESETIENFENIYLPSNLNLSHEAKAQIDEEKNKDNTKEPKTAPVVEVEEASLSESQDSGVVDISFSNIEEPIGVKPYEECRSVDENLKKASVESMKLGDEMRVQYVDSDKLNISFADLDNALEQIEDETVLEQVNLEQQLPIVEAREETVAIASFGSDVMCTPEENPIFMTEITPLNDANAITMPKSTNAKLQSPTNDHRHISRIVIEDVKNSFDFTLLDVDTNWTEDPGIIYKNGLFVHDTRLRCPVCVNI
jgi:hypothetical protein